MKLHKVLMYFKEAQALNIPPGRSVGGDRMTYCEFIMSKYFFKCTFNFKGNMLVNL